MNAKEARQKADEAVERNIEAQYRIIKEKISSAAALGLYYYQSECALHEKVITRLEKEDYEVINGRRIQW